MNEKEKAALLFLHSFELFSLHGIIEYHFTMNFQWHLLWILYCNYHIVFTLKDKLNYSVIPLLSPSLAPESEKKDSYFYFIT